MSEIVSLMKVEATVHSSCNRICMKEIFLWGLKLCCLTDQPHRCQELSAGTLKVLSTAFVQQGQVDGTHTTIEQWTTLLPFQSTLQHQREGFEHLHR